MTTQMRHCRCCGAEIKHNGWLAVCDRPLCESVGFGAHIRKKHLSIFRPGPGCYGVLVCDTDYVGCDVYVRSAYFDTEAQAKAFVARVRAGISKDEVIALIEAHKSPSKRITVEELRRRATEEP
jgi:hypothetical protein